eukprot:CAMPEP_0113666740 /NCGR_PEP_ID=MMETSP0038_2-20120614/3044_1 /TAXON_ID=2898 /ORGANISM="Cryptomonas paramecium" /LENGTH=62 /DNA_ID=CAMNT_0000582269 /DNA_START=616 /DNA_END=801 /DNA_ORIENTATION=+ /assembly_acc=CAM_ASM_000170
MGAGTATPVPRCLSCNKVVATFRPGPPPGMGREPVIFEGVDKRMYRAAKDPTLAGQRSPVWE